MKKYFLTIPFFLVLTAYCLLHTAVCFASGFSVGMYPPLTQIQADSGSNVSIPFSLQNYSKDTAIELKLRIAPFSSGNSFDGQADIMQENQQPNQKYIDFLKHITIYDGTNSITQISLSPTQQKQLSLQLDISKDVPLGDYYFSVVASSKPIFSDETNSSSIVGQIATNIILSVGPKSKPNGFIQDFSTHWFVFSGPTDFNLLLENASENVFAPQGNLVISNMFNQPVGLIQLLPVNILSHSSRFIPDDASGNTKKIIWKEKTLFGVYTANLTLSLSKEGPIFTRKIFFLAAPLQFVISFIVGVFIITFLSSRIISKIKHEN